MTVAPDVAAFEAEVRAFLGPFSRREHEGGSSFIWGGGSDTVSLYTEPQPDEEAVEIDRLRSWRRTLDAADLAWITGPRALGGRDLTVAHQRVFDRLVRDYEVPSSAPLVISLGMIAPTILAHASPAAQARYLRGMFAGDYIACQLFSEPGAGSDLAGVATQATEDAGGWRITGQKVWTSGAHYSDIGLILARTRSAPRHGNLSAFLIDMHAPGVTVRPLRQMTGGAAFNEVFLDGVWTPSDHLVGEKDDGWRVARTTLTNERSSLGGPGFAGTGLFSTERLKGMLHHFGLVDDPLVRAEFSKLIVGLRVARYLRLRSEQRARSGQTTGAELSLGKLALTQNLDQLSHFVARVLGPSLTADTGEWGTYAWSEFTLGVPGAHIGGGTDEILKTMIAERVLDLPREPRPTDRATNAQV